MRRGKRSSNGCCKRAKTSEGGKAFEQEVELACCICYFEADTLCLVDTLERGF